MGQPVVHFEIGCRDNQKIGRFYAELFGWKLEPFGGVNMINTGSGEGIGGHINSLGHEPHNYLTVYAMVDDLEAHLAKATRLGGKVVVPPTEVPNMGHFAWISDPEGTIFGLWKSAQQ